MGLPKLQTTKIPTPGFNQRNSVPDPANSRYINVNYGGLNKCIVRDQSNGFVLPNCTGYCWGRALETTKSTSVDLSNNQGSVWFSQNKKKWDEGTGGYPYLDFINKEVSLPGGIKQSSLSLIQMLKLMTIFVTPGNIICYGQGFSPSTGYTYDENGHVQTIEEIWGDVDAANRAKLNSLIGFIVFGYWVGLGSSGVAEWLMGTIHPLIAGFVIFLIQNRKIQTFLNIAKNLGRQALLKYLTGTPYRKLVENLSDDNFSRMVEIVEYYEFDGWPLFIALYVLLGTILYEANGATLLDVLKDVDLGYSPVFKVSESFYSGNTADHAAWETNYVSLQNEIGSVSPVVQGIIMVPPKLSKINHTKSDFPWETIDQYY